MDTYRVTGTATLGRNFMRFDFEMTVVADASRDAEARVIYLLGNHEHSQVEVRITSIAPAQEAA